ncbi:MAG TPA: phosphatidylglycerophosphatase A [Candidatus Babeliales bacterium]|nr:phosphatidylglycerophosphatase A [Candidatus Babeliales bacterium]
MGLGRIFKFIATLGPIGYLPAPGTAASAVVFFILFFVQPFLTPIAYSFLILMSCIVAWISVNYLQRYYQMGDAPEIVIDEYLGALVSMFLMPANWYVFLVGFTLFRLLDIYKPYLIGSCEKIPGATGVLLDDVVAGAVTNLILHVGIAYFFVL